MENVIAIEKRLTRIEDLLISQKTILNFNEAAEFIGISKSQLYKMTSKSEVPHYKPRGKQIYFNRGELEKWILRNPIKTRDEIEAEAEKYVMSNK